LVAKPVKLHHCDCRVTTIDIRVIISHSIKAFSDACTAQAAVPWPLISLPEPPSFPVQFGVVHRQEIYLRHAIVGGRYIDVDCMSSEQLRQSAALNKRRMSHGGCGAGDGLAQGGFELGPAVLNGVELG
jgi:hypothetical protein